MHDGSKLYLQKVAEDYNPTDKHDGAAAAARDRRAAASSRPASSTSSPTRTTSSTLLNLVDEPLATLPLERVRPPKAALDEIMDGLR